jgi:hypothetical protein
VNASIKIGLEFSTFTINRGHILVTRSGYSHLMNDTISPPPTRPTLKLKVGARRSADPSKAPATPQAEKKAKLKPGARWSDEYTQRMQADMDALRAR